MASVLNCTTGIHHSVVELKLRLLDCSSLHSLDCETLCLHRHGIDSYLVDELRPGISTVFCTHHNKHVYHSIETLRLQMLNALLWDRSHNFTDLLHDFLRTHLLNRRLLLAVF